MLTELPHLVLEEIVEMLMRSDTNYVGWYNSYEFHPDIPTRGDAEVARLAGTCKDIRERVLFFNRVFYNRVANITKRPKAYRHRHPRVTSNNWRRYSWMDGNCCMRPVSLHWGGGDMWVDVLRSVKQQPFLPDMRVTDRGYTGTPDKVIKLCYVDAHWEVVSYHLEKYNPDICYYDRLVAMFLRFMAEHLHRQKASHLKRKIENVQKKISDNIKVLNELNGSLDLANEKLKRAEEIQETCNRKLKKARRK